MYIKKKVILHKLPTTVLPPYSSLKPGGLRYRYTLNYLELFSVRAFKYMEIISASFYDAFVYKFATPTDYRVGV